MSATVNIAGSAGRIWTARPVVAGDGLVSTITQSTTSSVHRQSTIAKVAFTLGGDEAALATSAGTVMLFRIARCAATEP
jgi:hypothetical protein